MQSRINFQTEIRILPGRIKSGTLLTFHFQRFLYLEIVMFSKNTKSFIGALEVKKNLQEVIHKRSKNICREGLTIKQFALTVSITTRYLELGKAE